MRLPAYSELIDEQLEVLEYPLKKSLFVVGPPGSGKTSLAAHRAAAVADANYSGYVITYNRMLKRLLELLDTRLRPRTMHEFIGSEYRALTGRSGLAPYLGTDEFAFDWDKISHTFSTENRTHPTVEHLLIDEGQDLPCGFFAFSSSFSSTIMTVFADENQAYGASFTSLQQIKKCGKLDDPIILEFNHRNTPEIAKIAQHFHGGGLPLPRVARQPSGELPTFHWMKNTVHAASLIGNWITSQSGTVGVIVVRNSFGRSLYQELSTKPLIYPVKFYEHHTRNENDINILQPSITIINVESVKGQEFDSVFIMELERLLPCQDQRSRRVMYMLCSRARDHLFLMREHKEILGPLKQSLPGPALLERR